MKTHSEIIKGEMVTTHLKYDGIGLGYLIDGEVWKTTGSYYGVKASDDVFPMLGFDRDNGEGYLKRAKKLTGWNI